MGHDNRTYAKTHPWINFRLDARSARPKLWMALGEAQSKCEHIAGVPLRPSTQQSLHRLFLAKGTLATTAIEGNTLTEGEVLRHFQGELELPPSKEYLKHEIDNIVVALNRIWDKTADRQSLNRLLPADLREFNTLVLANLSLPPEVIPGEPRSYEVSVGQYHGAPAKDCPYLLDRLCDWLNGDDFRPIKGFEIVYGLMKAVLAHLYLAWIHPFGDGNGRTARLVEFQILIAAGVPTPAAHLLSNHYNQTREEYYRQLGNASKSPGGVLDFIDYAVGGFIDGLREQLDIIRQQQWDVAWRNYVHEECAKEQNEDVRRRRRHVVLDLGNRTDPVPVSAIRLISARVAQEYAAKSSKTLSRDIDALIEEGLLLKTAKGVVANRSIILAFLPARRGADPDSREDMK